MYDNCLTQSTRERLLVIAYKRAVCNKDTTLLTLLRSKYITVGHEDIFLDNHTIKITYFLSLTDQEAFELIRFRCLNMGSLNTLSIGTMYE